MLVVIVFTQRLSSIMIVSDCVKLFHLLVAWQEVNVKGQGHLKTKAKVTKNYEKSLFCLIFMLQFLTHGAYTGSCHCSKVKGHGLLKVIFCAIISYN